MAGTLAAGQLVNCASGVHQHLGFMSTHPPKTASCVVAAQNLSVGMRLWGAVAEVSPRGLVVSLPHGLRGHVSAAEVSLDTPAPK